MFVSKLDRAAQSAGPEVIELIEGIASWTLSLQGRIPMVSGLSRLREAFGAEAVVLTRVGRTRQCGSQVLAADRRAGDGDVESIDRSFASRLLGPYLFKPRAGSTWYSETEDIKNDDLMCHLYQQRGISDLVIVVLEVGEKAIFFLELHFGHRLCADSRRTMQTLGDSLMTLWNQRAIGSFSEALLKGRPATVAQDARKGMPIEIISIDNPANLSRAEFRVCTLLGSGLSTEHARKELGISASTMRSHLRQVYIKTGCKNLAELVFNLLAADLPASHTIASTALRSIS